MDFFSKILRHPEKKPVTLSGAGKKILLFILFFIVFSFGFFGIKPDTAQAQACTTSAECAAIRYGAFCENGTCHTYGSIGQWGTQPLDPTSVADITKIQCGGVLDFYCGVVTGFAKMVDSIFYGIASFAGQLFNGMLEYTMNNSITKDGAFTKGWASVRDLANMLIVLGFVAIGIAFTLRIEGYGTKKALINLILVALLINFSGLFCGLIIDASHIMMKSLSSGGGDLVNGGMGTTFVESTHKYALLQAKKAFGVGASSGANAYFMAIVVYIPYYIALIVTFFAIAIILIERYAILAILYVLSPIAFAFWGFPFPDAKALWKKWWEKFLKWTFVGVETLFFVWLANEIVVKYGGIDKMTWMQMIVVLVIMFVGAKIAVKSGGVASTAVIGMAGGAVGMAMGAVAGGGKGLAKMADKATGGVASSAYQKVSSKVGNAMERLGLRKEGATASANSKRVNEEASSLKEKYEAAKATGDTATVERIQEQARTGRGSKGGAAMKVVTDAKDVGATFKGHGGTAAASARLSYAESAGASGIRKEAVKSNPNLARTPEELTKAVQNQGARELTKNLDADAITPAVLAAMDSKQMTHLANNGAKAKTNAMDNLLNTKAGKAQLQAHATDLIKNKKIAELAAFKTKTDDARKLSWK